jgi:hypothetical protein
MIGSIDRDREHLDVSLKPHSQGKHSKPMLDVTARSLQAPLFPLNPSNVQRSGNSWCSNTCRLELVHLPKYQMSVLLETSVGDIVVDLLVDQAPKCCEK